MWTYVTSSSFACPIAFVYIPFSLYISMVTSDNVALQVYFFSKCSMLLKLVWLSVNKDLPQI